METKTNIVRYSKNQFCEYLGNLNKWISGTCSTSPVDCFVVVNGTTVRVRMYDESFLPIVETSLRNFITAPQPYDYSIVLWKTAMTFNENYRVFGDCSSKPETCITFYENGNVRGFENDSKTFFCGYPSIDAEFWASWGDPLLRQFHSVINLTSSVLVHGACVGLDGKGVLLCARGGKGKSTLAVASLVSGFDFVSDDYLIVGKDENILWASPVYSTVKLSYQMYEVMKRGLGNAPVVADISQREKYVIDISSFGGSIKTKYPIKACVMPQIVPGLQKPEILECSQDEKGAAVIHIVHSTISQLTYGRDNAYNLKLMQFFRDRAFYKILLSRDIFANVECLRAFLKNL